MTMDIVIFTKGAAKVAVDAGDQTTQAQLRADGWQMMSQQTTQRPEQPEMENPMPDQAAVNRAALATPPIPGWHPDLPPNMVGKLMARYGSPEAAAAATDDDLFLIGGMRPATISLIRSGMQAPTVTEESPAHPIRPAIERPAQDA